MAAKMLIDASHPEETRVVVVRGTRIEEFDFESQHKKQIRGNIYLAKVTRVEPSLQAAFVDYGGNRHGFLAFSEIHPDYYQIPLADRQAVLQAEAEDARNDPDFESADEEPEAKPAPKPAAEARSDNGDDKNRKPRARRLAKRCSTKSTRFIARIARSRTSSRDSISSLTSPRVPRMSASWCTTATSSASGRRFAMVRVMCTRPLVSRLRRTSST